MRLNIVVLRGDGVGPEVPGEAVCVLREVGNIHGQNVHCEELPVGGSAIRQNGSPLPRATLDACLAADAVLLGAIGSPEFDHRDARQRPEAGLLLLRKALGGFANLRPVNSYAVLAGAAPLRSEVVEGAAILFVRNLPASIYFAHPRHLTSPNAPTVPPH